jgi:hypothetical protein
MARVERRLPAADLSAGELDVESRLAEQRVGIGDRLREDEVADAGSEELNPSGQDESR